MNYLERAKELVPEITENRRHIHHNPEAGMDVEQTAAYVKMKLEEMGYTPRDIGKNGVTAAVGKGSGIDGGKVFLLRADMDALRMQEESGLEFASQNPGVAHCCGHDLHTSMLLGAARMLKENEDALEGTVKLLFQPGEEDMQGARNMLEAGILDGPKVDAALCIHVNSVVPAGVFMIFQGPACASSDLFTIRVKGHGTHGSTPNKGVDPINAAAHIHIALQELQAREIRAGEVGVLTIGSIHGGSAFNVIPNEVKMQGTIRTYSKEIREMVIERMKEISESVAKAFRAQAEVIMDENYAIPLVADDKVALSAYNALGEIFQEKQLKLLSKCFPGSEDFAFIADTVPSSFIVLGAAVGKDVEYGQHHPKVRFNESCLPLGAAAYAQVAEQWLREHA